ncbi:M56 family metallopeptidase [Streptomyces sp. MJP52]|uniref:M56 family metallopeptidase n=1 Tax=Streptomyces sp. MJP52 TaxID=2940555 RepID=UPI0024739BBE|nr:M56 family metallopeptidase [Streptomyces sp. MJP52]MDH6223989.1 Zn-dependent protease with chaperone function [Streptomyces sp. MJP52]
MTSTLFLAGYAAFVGVFAPRVLARARWTHRAPRLAVLAWYALMATFLVTVTLAAYHLVLREQHVHDGLVGLLSACGLFPVGSASHAAADPATLLPPALVVLLPAGWFLDRVWRTRRAQRRHVALLAVVGNPSADHDAVIVDHDTPAVYCLPGRYRQVVVTRAAIKVLSQEQLGAVLAHERAHIAGRHHLCHAMVDAFGRSFPGLPLARQAKGQVALLLEMAADDRALRLHSRENLAAAMCEVAAGRAPRAAFGAGGSSAAVRLHRLLVPAATPGRAARLGVVGGSLAALLVPLLIACGPFFG